MANAVPAALPAWAQPRPAELIHFGKPPPNHHTVCGALGTVSEADYVVSCVWCREILGWPIREGDVNPDAEDEAPAGSAPP